MKPIDASYENGLLKPAKPLSLQEGERVRLIVVRRPDPRRWDIAKIAATAGNEDLSLAQAGLDDWVGALDSEDSA